MTILVSFTERSADELARKKDTRLTIVPASQCSRVEMIGFPTVNASLDQTASEAARGKLDMLSKTPHPSGKMTSSIAMKNES
jgi:hypothetical protein